ncbi:MAG: sigma 54-interacting transcriptional regulator [Calditrichia bacterium]
MSPKSSEIFKSKNKHRHHLEALIDLAVILGQQNDFQEVLRLVIRKSISLAQAEISLIMMINPKTHQTIKTIFASGEDAAEKDYHFIHTNICGWVLKHNRSFISRDIAADPRFHQQLFSGLAVKSALCVPFRVEGIIIGTLMLMRKESSAAFSEEDLRYMEKYAAIAAPFLRNTQKIQEYFVAPIPREALLKKYQAFGLLGKSKKYVDLLKSVEAAARTDVRIQLEGKSGTGKELIARAIHNLSSRSGNQFIAIDCGAIPANLMESELFGHVRGAFTGASTDRKGLMEEANGGTLFMDEISNLPLELQAKMLRVLQEGEIRPVGSNRTRAVDVRIISASSLPLHKLVGEGKFREDLFFRLHVYPIVVPSLDERNEDVPILADCFLRKFAGQQNKKAELFHEKLLDFMRQRPWQGNIRELENFVERLVTMASADSKILDCSLLPDEYRKELQKSDSAAEAVDKKKSLTESLAEYEKQFIRKALTDNDWNQSAAARNLGISEQSIRYKMNRLGIVKPE